MTGRIGCPHNQLQDQYKYNSHKIKVISAPSEELKHILAFRLICISVTGMGK